MGRQHHAGAVDWAASVQPGTPVRWKALELAAWHRHRQVLAAMEPGRHRGPGFWLVPAMLLFGLAAPTVGIALLLAGGSRSGFSVHDRVERIPAAGALFLVADLVLVPFVVWLLAKPSQRRGSSGLGLYALVMGLGAALPAHLAAQEVGMPRRWLWLTPMIVTAAAGLVMLVIGGMARLKDHPTDMGNQPASGGRRSAIRAAVADVSESEREVVETQLRRAIGDLADRGLIDRGDAERALTAPLGGLSQHMSQRGGQTAVQRDDHSG